MTSDSGPVVYSALCVLCKKFEEVLLPSGTSKRQRGNYCISCQKITDLEREVANLKTILKGTCEWLELHMVTTFREGNGLPDWNDFKWNNLRESATAEGSSVRAESVIL